MKLSTTTLAAAAMLLLSGTAFAEDLQMTRPCPSTQQAARGNDSGKSDAQLAARGNNSGNPPDSQTERSQLAAATGCE